MKNGPQRERGRNDKRGRDGENYKERSSLLHPARFKQKESKF
jgi:hypothetical protein